MKKIWVLALSGQGRLWLDCADAQADLSLRLAHTHFVGFVMSWLIYWASMWENLSSGVWEQQRRRPACTSVLTGHPYFVIHISESIISKLATRKISTFKTGLNLILSETLKTGFVALRPIWCYVMTLFSRSMPRPPAQRLSHVDICVVG